MPKICYISPLSIHSIRYLEAFHQKGYNMSIIADSHTWVAPTPKSIPIYILPQLTRTNIHKRLIPNFLTLTRTLKKINPDLVHLHAQHYYSPIIILLNTPYILTSWGTEVLTLPNENPLIKATSKIAATKASKITVDANLLKKIWTQIGIPKNKVEIIPFGVDLKTFNPNANGVEIRQKLKIKKTDTVLISTRALHNHHYNVETLIRAIPIILKTNNNTKFIIKGKGPLENHLKNLANKLGVTEHIRWVSLIPHDQIANYLAAADIYISTCYIDTTSVSLLEAMACGLAPIVTDIEGNREWIKNGENGLLFPPKNPTALAEKAIKLIQNKDVRKRFGEKCLQTVKQKASWEDCVSKMEHIYQSILSKQNQ